MGFKRKPKIYHIIWNEGDLAGLEVKMRALSVGTLLDLTEAAAAAKDDRDLSSTIEPFAAALQDWNLEDEQGRAVPANLKGIKTQDLGFITAIITKWMSVIADVDIPLPQASNSGVTSLEESLNLDALSRSLVS